MNYHKQYLTLALLCFGIISGCTSRDRGSLPLDFSTPETLLNTPAQTPTNRVHQLRQGLRNENGRLSTLRNKTGETVLHLAAKDGNLEVFKDIISAANNDTWRLISA